MNKIDPQSWKSELPAFREMTEKFHRGEVDKNSYKGFSGFYGSYAQRGGELHMLRLRMTAGEISKPKMKFISDSIKKYGVTHMHFTTCQAVQFHDLDVDTTCAIMEEALNVGIVTIGGGGDYPRNVMCSHLTGTEPGECFDVMPYAQAAADYLMNFVKAEKMPRKLKVSFSNSPMNFPHATFRDLGFVARPDGKFDVYSAGGLGNNAKFGVQVAEAIEPDQIFYYIKAMWLTFRTYGNYQSRAKARTRYMQDSLGSAEAYRAAYQEKLKEVYDSGEDLKLEVVPRPVTKKGDGSVCSGVRVLPQKQEGLYTVLWHPIGGKPDPEDFCKVADAVYEIPDAIIRISPDETACIINLTGSEAAKILELTSHGATTIFETSISCVGAVICQVGLRDSQGLLTECVKAVKEAGIVDGALPRVHISGCPSSCGTHQIGSIGFRGASAKVNGKTAPGFILFVNGNDRQGQETMGREVCALAAEKIPAFLVELGKTVQDSGMNYEDWNAKNPDGIDKIALNYK